MPETPMRCARCGSTGVTRAERDRFRCEHCGAEGPAMRRARPRADRNR